MNFEEAIKLKTGSKVYDCFGNKLLVYAVDFNLSFVDGKEKKTCFINTIDSKLDKVKLSHENVFVDQEFLSDEEKIFVDWISNNKDFINRNQDVLHVINYAFMQGFAEGYKYKKLHTIQELMEK
jgi:hypothetical protein